MTKTLYFSAAMAKKMTTSRPKFTILWGHVEEILLLDKVFFPIVDTCLIVARQSCAMVPRWWFLVAFCAPCFQRAACSRFQTCILNSH